MKNITYLLFAIAICITCSGYAQGNKGMEGANKSFSTWKENVFMDSLWATFPDWASQQGYHKYDSKLNLPGVSSIKERLMFIDWVDRRLKGFDFANLSDLNKTDYRMLENFVAGTRFSINEFKEYEWNPALYNVGDAIEYVISNNPAPLETKLKELTSRLSQVPLYYMAARKGLVRPTKEHLELAKKQTLGLFYLFDNVLPDSVKASILNQAQKDDFNKAASEAKGAIKAYLSFLQGLENNLSASSTRPFAIGKDLYAKKFQYEINSRYTAAEMYQKATDRKTVLHDEMFALTRQLWSVYMKGESMPKDKLQAIKMLIDKLSEKHCKPDEFITTIEKQLPELTAFIEDHKLISMDPAKPLRVRKTPEYMAGVAGASINSPGPYDSEGNTYYNVTPLTGYTPDMAESYLREYNSYVLHILNIHEAIPGHYVQMIYANKSPSIIKAVFGNGAMIEGWACYVERMMIEAGYHNSPEMKLFYDKWNLREVCNFLLDYNIHTKGWSEAQVMDLLVKEAFQQAAEAKEKYKRATLSQVQLASYFAGQTEIFELRETQKKKLGANFDLKKFHEQFLSYGSAPVKEIWELMK